ncbi:hypothetical protein MAR_000894 [Mya arenaria]|uniref:Uncharacterized protein n=1 Tax=Mya arenaria TaxID=6604 RepID=A0ABY7FE58_MYAAR|nr:hypothetical protein MAR_000894 [Mya arenaria]
MVHSKDQERCEQNKECMYTECRQCKEKQLSCENADGKHRNQRIDKEKDGKKKVVNKTVKENSPRHKRNISRRTK